MSCSTYRSFSCWHLGSHCQFGPSVSSVKVVRHRDRIFYRGGLWKSADGHSLTPRWGLQNFLQVQRPHIEQNHETDHGASEQGSLSTKWQRCPHCLPAKNKKCAIDYEGQ